ncbi:MAG: hypothetical protein CTY34_02020 [Methylobacter sp.]|nr:MAG: hypothetical protein CTY34_02020 [Methylobacter sp.]
MSESNDMGKILEAVGELRGELKVIHQSIAESMRIIREDLRAYKSESNQRIESLEDRVNSRFDKVDDRLKGLEDEDKKTIEKVARLGVVGGGAAGAMVTGLIEVLKRMS